MYVDNNVKSLLAQNTIFTIRAPQRRGRPKIRPEEMVADKDYDSAEFRRKPCLHRIKPAIPTFERRKRKQVKRCCSIRTGLYYRQRSKVRSYFDWMDNYSRLVIYSDCHLEIYKTLCFGALVL